MPSLTLNSILVYCWSDFVHCTCQLIHVYEDFIWCIALRFWYLWATYTIPFVSLHYTALLSFTNVHLFACYFRLFKGHLNQAELENDEACASIIKTGWWNRDLETIYETHLSETEVSLVVNWQFHANANKKGGKAVGNCLAMIGLDYSRPVTLSLSVLTGTSSRTIVFSDGYVGSGSGDLRLGRKTRGFS